MSIGEAFKNGMKAAKRDAIARAICRGNYTAQEIAEKYNIELRAAVALIAEAERIRTSQNRGSGFER